jgi:hypothetical protein
MKRMMVLTVLWGFCTLCPAAWADECVEGDCYNGYGKMVYTPGYTYEGGFSDGRRDGFARLTDIDGSEAVGIWVDGEISEGTIRLPDGTQYIGQWQYRERDGEGILIQPDGTRYVGEFDSGRRHGWGITVYPDGRKYAGQFDKGQRTGWGTLTYPDGRRYVGEFRNGARTGQGTMLYPDGRTVSGRFVDGELQK